MFGLFSHRLNHCSLLRHNVRTYEYVNVVLFCYVEPVLTVLMILGALYALFRLPKAKHEANAFMWTGIVFFGTDWSTTDCVCRKRLYTISEAARILGVSRSYFYYCFDHDELFPKPTLVNGMTRLNGNDIIEIIALRGRKGL